MELADSQKDAWQFRFVSEFGSTTGRSSALGADVPLLVTRGNIPIGSNAGTPADPLSVTRPYLLVQWGLPADVPGFALTGRVTIVRRSRGFSRDYADVSAGRVRVVASYNLTAEIGTIERGVYFGDRARLDDRLGDGGDVWYYTIFYECNTVAGTQWCFSPTYSFARNWAYKNVLDTAGKPRSRYGDRLFAGLPRGIKILDFKEANDATYRLLQAVGRIFDQVDEELDQKLRTFYNVEEVDAAFLPYIDWLLGWPTNYELSEIKRRVETLNVTTLWKAKGTVAALELVLQTVTGWDIETVEGWKWVKYSYDTRYPALEAASPPSDWGTWAVSTAYETHQVIEHGGATYDARLDHTSSAADEPGVGAAWETYWELLSSSVWADLVAGVPLNQSYDSTNPAQGRRRGTQSDTLCYSFSNEEVVETGVGWWWQNPNGLLIIMTEVPGVSQALSETLLRKVQRITPLFLAHYTAFAVMIEQQYGESLDLFGGDWHQDNYVSAEAWQLLTGASEYDLATTPDLSLHYSWPNPVFPFDDVSNSPWFANYHAGLAYGGALEEVPVVDIAHNVLANGTEGEKPGGHTHFDPNQWPAGSTFRFEVVLSVTDAATVGEAKLYNLDTGALVNIGAGLQTSSTDPEVLSSGNLTPGAGANDLQDTDTIYEVRVSNDGGVVGKWTVLGVASIRAFYF